MLLLQITRVPLLKTRVLLMLSRTRVLLLLRTRVLLLLHLLRTRVLLLLRTRVLLLRTRVLLLLRTRVLLLLGTRVLLLLRTRVLLLLRTRVLLLLLAILSRWSHRCSVTNFFWAMRNLWLFFRRGFAIVLDNRRIAVVLNNMRSLLSGRLRCCAIGWTARWSTNDGLSADASVRTGTHL